MSNILKGILNESNPFYGHNDPAREYGADDPPRFNKSRSSYRSQEDDDEYDPYGLIRQEKDFAKGRAMKAAEKAQRDSDHDRLATGTNEGLDDPWGDQGNFAGSKPVNLGGVSIKNIQVGDTVKYLGQPSHVVAMSKDRKYSRITISKGMGEVTQDVLTSDLRQLGQGKAIEEDNTTRMRMGDYHNLADAIQEKLRQAIKLGNKELIHKLNKERDELDARVKQHGLVPESQLDELSTDYLTQYKTAAGKDASKADSEGNYNRGNKRMRGITNATKKQFANDTKKSAISQGINELAIGPTGPKGPKDYGQPNSSRYIGKDKFVVGTTNNYVLTSTVDKWGLEWDEDDEIWFLDSPGAVYIADATEGEIELPAPQEQRNQIHDLVSDYLNEHNSPQLQQVAAYFGHSDDGEMATNESISANRFNSKQEVINHFVKNGKSAAAGSAAWERGWRGSSNKPIELKKPPQRSYHDELDDKRYSNTFETLGNQLKPTSFEELVKAKLIIARQIEADAEAFKQDLYKNNTVQKAQQDLRKEFEPTPVAQPGEKHSVLKARLAQLNNAIQKQELLDKLVDRLERRGILTPAMQNDADTTMHVRYGAKDNYESLNKKLDNAISTLQSRLNIRKISGLKEVHDERDEYDNPRQGRDYGKGNLFVDPGSNEFKKEVHLGANDGELGRPKNLKGISKALPADAFGRTTGKIPDSARPTLNPDPFPPAKILKNHEKWIYPPKDKKSMEEGWSQKYKSSINCSHPKGFSQKAHCAGKKKHNESIEMEMVCEDCGMCETHGDNSNDQLDELKCWPGHHRVAGTKAGFPGSCAKNKTNEEGVAEEQLNELDMFAPVTTFIKMTDGSYIQANWRRHQFSAGLEDSASFINFKPVNPNVAKQLGLDNYQRNKSISNYRNGTIAHGGAYQGSGPLATRGYEVVDYNKPETMEELPPEIKPALIKWVQKQNVAEESCPHCNGPMFSEMIMNEKKDACYYKVKSRYKVWPSAYASGALVKCRNKGASNWGNGGKKNESSILEGINRADESLHDWFNKEKWVRMDTKGKIKGPCAKEPGEGKPKCLPQSKAHSLGKKGRASAAQRKRREDPNPDRSGKAINVDTKKSKG